MHRTIRTDADIDRFAAMLRHRKLPVTVSITAGERRSDRQNRTAFLWCKEAAEQLGDRTANDVRAWAKLHLGVPILRRDDEAFRARYDEVVRPLDYGRKLALMVEPFDFPITRLMVTKQQSEYMDAMQRELSAMGVALTDPALAGWQ